MTPLRAIELFLCVCTLCAFGWGMGRFFYAPSGLTPYSRLVALFGLGFALVQLWALSYASLDPWRSTAATTLYSAALALFVWAVRACRRHRLTVIFERDVRLNLIRRGPFRYIRHPFYTAYIVFWTAGWIATNSPGALVSVITMSAIYIWAARQEELRFGTSQLSADYAAYREKTGFMVPVLSLRRWDDEDRNTALGT